MPDRPKSIGKHFDIKTLATVDGIAVLEIIHNEDGTFDVLLSNGTRYFKCFTYDYVPPAVPGVVDQEIIHIEAKIVEKMRENMLEAGLLPVPKSGHSAAKMEQKP